MRGGTVSSSCLFVRRASGAATRVPNWTVRALLRAQYSNAVCIYCEIVRRIVPIVALALLSAGAECGPEPRERRLRVWDQRECVSYPVSLWTERGGPGDLTTSWSGNSKS